jgi:hypothetical protein
MMPCSTSLHSEEFLKYCLKQLCCVHKTRDMYGIDKRTDAWRTTSILVPDAVSDLYEILLEADT